MKGAGGLLKYDHLKVVSYSAAVSRLPLNIAVHCHGAKSPATFTISQRGHEDRMLLGSFFFLSF